MEGSFRGGRGSRLGLSRSRNRKGKDGRERSRRRRPGRRPPLRRRRYGSRCSPRCVARGVQGPADDRDGAVRLGQVDADAHPRRARPPDRRQRRDRRHRDHHAGRHGSDEAPARAHRLHLPVLQSAADAHGGGEHRPAADHRGREGRQGVAGAADRVGRVEGPADAPALGALRRPAATRRDRARSGFEADRGLRRRADRQPRLEDRAARSSSSSARPCRTPARRP